MCRTSSGVSMDAILAQGMGGADRLETCPTEVAPAKGVSDLAIVVVDVEAGENCPYSMQLVFSGLEEARVVRRVRLYLLGPEGVWYDVTGWSDEGPCDAFALAVEDSGQARAYLVHGGNEGLRFRPAGSSEEWGIGVAGQWGDSHLLLSDAEDIVWPDDH